MVAFLITHYSHTQLMYYEYDRLSVSLLAAQWHIAAIKSGVGTPTEVGQRINVHDNSFNTTV